MVQVLKFNQKQIQSHVLVCYHKRILLRCTCMFLMLLKTYFTCCLHCDNFCGYSMAINSLSQYSKKKKKKESVRDPSETGYCCWRSQHELFNTEINNNKTIILIIDIKLSPLALGITKTLVKKTQLVYFQCKLPDEIFQCKLPDEIRVRIHIYSFPFKSKSIKNFPKFY